MSLERMLGHLLLKYFQAKESRTVAKPMTWALYETWKWVDAYEAKGRHKSKSSEHVDPTKIEEVMKK